MNTMLIDAQTISSGATGDLVATWQKIIGVTADGAFGPQTLAATKSWQAAHGLVADGIVGPLTWAKASEVTSTGARPAWIWWAVGLGGGALALAWLSSRKKRRR